MESTEWQPFLGFSSRGGAEAVAAVLQSEEVPTLIEPSRLAAGIESDFVLSVPAHLAHRARWVLAQSDFAESELTYLATGEFPARR
jgi:hypothetical protein